MSILKGINKIAKEALKDIDLDLKRTYRTEFVPAGIKPALAFMMLKIAKIQKDENVLDPFCGAGVIPIECALAGWGNKIFGSDIKGTAISKAMINAKNAQVDKTVKLFRSDVSKIKIPHGLVNVIVTNLPFGIRVGSHKYNLDTYSKFYIKTKKLLSANGRIIVLTQEKRLIQEIFTKEKLYKIVDIYEVDSGGLSPNIYVLKKLTSEFGEKLE